MDVKTAQPARPCRVCGAAAINCNFGVVSCEPCKAFFRRNAFSQNLLAKECQKNCIITKETRTTCKSCRLQKCFREGMVKDLILTKEQLHERRKKSIDKKVQMHPQMEKNVLETKRKLGGCEPLSFQGAFIQSCSTDMASDHNPQHMEIKNRLKKHCFSRMSGEHACETQIQHSTTAAEAETPRTPPHSPFTLPMNVLFDNEEQNAAQKIFKMGHMEEANDGSIHSHCADVPQDLESLASGTCNSLGQNTADSVSVSVHSGSVVSPHQEHSMSVKYDCDAAPEVENSSLNQLFCPGMVTSDSSNSLTMQFNSSSITNGNDRPSDNSEFSKGSNCTFPSAQVETTSSSHSFCNINGTLKKTTLPQNTSSGGITGHLSGPPELVERHYTVGDGIDHSEDSVVQGNSAIAVNGDTYRMWRRTKPPESTFPVTSTAGFKLPFALSITEEVREILSMKPEYIRILNDLQRACSNALDKPLLGKLVEHPNMMELFDQVEGLIPVYVAFAKHLEGFKKFTLTNQIAIVKASFTVFVGLYVLPRFDSTTKTFCLTLYANNFQNTVPSKTSPVFAIDGSRYNDVYKIAVNQLKCDTFIILLLICFLLFNSNAELLHKNEELVVWSQLYLEILNHYISKKYPDGEVKPNDVDEFIVAFKRTAMWYEGIIETIDMASLKPAVREIFGK